MNIKKGWIADPTGGINNFLGTNENLYFYTFIVFAVL
jgi:hypothetical protein